MNPKGDEHKIFTRDGQGELFSEFETEKTKKPGYLFRRDIELGKKITLNLSYENLLLFAIVFIMLLVVFFSLGVEKGKRVAVTHVKVEAYSRLHGLAEEERLADAEGKVTAPVIDKSDVPKVAKTIETAEEKEGDVSAKKYTVQVIAFKNAENAEKEMRRLKNEGYEAFIIPSKEWLQVCVGRYGNMEQSKADFEVLKKRYPSCYFRKIE